MRISFIGLFLVAASATLYLDVDAAFLLALAGTLIAGYGSLHMLADRPLLNPVQAPVFLFLWWIAAGAVFTALMASLVSPPEEAIRLQEDAVIALWITALGLPLFSLGAKAGLAMAPGDNWLSRHIAPRLDNYRLQTILLLLLIGGGSSFLIHWQTAGVSEVTYLGAIRTEAWWAGVLLGMSLFLGFSQSALMKSLVDARSGSSRLLPALAVAVILISLLAALTAGTKSAFILTLLFLMCAYISKEQRPPLGWLLVVVLVFLVTVEPFVAQGRRLAEEAGAETSQERRSIFAELGSASGELPSIELAALNIGTLFRGISLVGGRIANASSMFEGTWETNTLAWGLEAQIPRSLASDKPDLNIGNYIARTTGWELGWLVADDEVTNISPAIPFEVVGNCGWLAGVLAFPALGFIWAILCATVLSNSRLETHPLTPLFVSLSLFFEAPFGHFLASMKAYLIPLIALALLSMLTRRNI